MERGTSTEGRHGYMFIWSPAVVDMESKQTIWPIGVSYRCTTSEEAMALADFQAFLRGATCS